MASSLDTATILILFSIVAVRGASRGTTPHLKEIFLGRCFQYQETREDVVSPQILKKNCTQLYESFARAVGLKTSCKGDFSKIFDDYFTIVDPGLTLKDKALFWSGTNHVAHELSEVNPDYITLEDTFPGKLLNNINFCPGNNPQPYNFTECSCPWSDSAAFVFWRGVSKQFAKNANGYARVFINGTRNDNQPAYRNNSIFAEVELPNINNNLVKKIEIFVGLDLGVKAKEKCNSKSIMKMQTDIKKRKITVSCEDNPRVVFYVMCSNKPNFPACVSLKKSIEQSSVSQAWKLAAITLAVSSAVLLLALIITVAMICRNSQGFKFHVFN